VELAKLDAKFLSPGTEVELLSEREEEGFL